MDYQELREFQDIFEGVRTTAYYDSVGVITIGRGHSNKRYPQARLGEVWSMEQVNEVWQDDMDDFYFNLAERLKTAANEHELNVLLDMSFQFGNAAINGSTLAKLVLQGKHNLAQKQVLKWINAGGRPVLGIIKRAFARYVMWEGGDWRPIANTDISSKDWHELNEAIEPLGYEVIKENGRFKING